MLLIAMALTNVAQISVGFKDSPYGKMSKFKPGDLEGLKKTTTVFVLPNNMDDAMLQSYEKIIGEVWKYTPFKVVQSNERKAYEGKSEYSLFAFETAERQIHYNNVWEYQHFYYYQLTTRVGKKMKVYAEVAMPLPLTLFDSKNNDNGQQYMPYSMLGGYFKCYLMVINNYLNNEIVYSNADDRDDKEALKQLANETLYVTESMMTYSTRFSTKLKSYTEEEFFKKYPYPHKLTNTRELSELILDSPKPVYFYNFVHVEGSRTYLAVYNSKSNEMVITTSSKNSDCQPGDMHWLANQIEKAIKGK